MGGALLTFLVIAAWCGITVEAVTAAGDTGLTRTSPSAGYRATSSPSGSPAGDEYSGTLTRLPTAPEDPWLRGPSRLCQPSRRHDSAFYFKCTHVYTLLFHFSIFSIVFLIAYSAPLPVFTSLSLRTFRH